MPVSIFNIHTPGDAAGKACEFDWGALQSINQVRGCSLTGDRRTRGDQHFIGGPAVDPGEELAYFYFLWADTVHWREDTVQDVVMPPEAAGFLDGQEVAGLFDHADNCAISFGIRAYCTGVGFRKSETAGAELDGSVQFRKRSSQLKGLRDWTAEDVESQAGCGFSADAWQFAEAFDESFEGRWDNLHGMYSEA